MPLVRPQVNWPLFLIVIPFRKKKKQQQQRASENGKHEWKGDSTGKRNSFSGYRIRFFRQ